MLICDILKQKSSAMLFTRPRRFGKTLTQSMLRTFFEKELLPDGTASDNSIYFKGKKIMNSAKEYTRHLGQYPVISLSLKSAKQPDYEMSYAMILKEIIHEFERHRYILKGDSLHELQKEQCLSIMNHKASPSAYAYALQFLSQCLEQFHHKKTIILIDEYDVPLENAFFNGYYDKMVSFIRSLFESALKTNDSLEFAVITGCLRISQESIFTGLNHLDVISVLDNHYAEYFGFTQQEVNEMLLYYDMTEKTEEVKNWYNGYLFGHTEIYNPWSVLNYIRDILYQNTIYPKPYWANTSSNSIVRELIEYADSNTKKELEQLIAGNSIEKPVHENITYANMRQSQDNLWNFLFFTGYLKATGQRFQSDTIWLILKIPNREIQYIYNHTISEWFMKKISTLNFSTFYNAVVHARTEVIEKFVKKQLQESISYMDSAENFYHGLLLYLLSGLPDYEKLSNRESGSGRYDILLKPYHEQLPTIIFEIKRAVRFTDMEGLCQKALAQIEERHYGAELWDEGYPVIIKYGICFCKKSCVVREWKNK